MAETAQIPDKIETRGKWLTLKAIAFLAFFGLATSVNATEKDAVAVEQEFLDLVSDMEKGRRDRAIDRISGIFSLSGLPRLVTTRDKFVDLVLGCKSKRENSRTGPYISIHRFSWNCDGKIYEAWLGKDPKSSYVEVVDPEDEERIATRKNTPSTFPSAPPPPVPAAPEERSARLEKENTDRLAVLSDLDTAFKSDSFVNVSHRITELSQFSLGFRDMAQHVFIAEMDGNGLEEAENQLAWLTKNIGKAASVSCRQKPMRPAGSSYQYFFTSCSVRSVQPGNGFTAILKTRGGIVTSLQFNYMNAKVFEKNRDYIISQGAAQ